MKILHIRFANLNSLAGGWAIDLTGPEYAVDGIFAITGPTGAGKSTILDAVCLALYGRTPRLKQVSKSTNEIMTRHTGECWSEVEFSTSKGRYRCHWSQHRARKSAVGDLQPPRHEIVDAATNRPLETKVKLVAQKVVDVTGMTYEQFTRSILLAQGDFNTFLKAPPDERAPILEQITGTDIYSRISRKVHERRGEELAQFELLRKECDGFTPLTEEQLANLNTQLADLSGKAGQIQGYLSHNRSLLDWYLAQERLQREIGVQETKLKELDRNWLDLALPRQRLAAADKAKSLEPLHLRLVEEQTFQKKEQNEQELSARLLAHKAKELDETCKKETTAREEREKIKQASRELEVTLRQVRKLDQQLQMVAEQRTSLTNQLATELSRKKNTEKLLENLISQNAAIELQVKTLEQYRSEHAMDGSLVQEYSGLKEQIDQYQEAANRHKALADQLPPLLRQCKLIGSLAEAKRSETSNLIEQRTALEQQETTCAEKLAQQLGDTTPEQLYEKESQLQIQLNLLDQAEELARRRTRIATELATLAARRKTGTERQKLLSNRCQELVEQVRLQQANVEKQQQIVHLAEKVKSFEEERKQLRDNHPCPLCGSLSHPYGGDAREPDESRELASLKAENQRLDYLREQLAADRTALASQEKEHELVDLNISARTTEQAELGQHIARISSELGLHPDHGVEEQLPRLRPDLISQRDRLRMRREEVQTLKNQLENAVRSKTNLVKRSGEAERELQQHLHQLEKIETLQHQHSSELKELQQLITDRQTALTNRLAPYINAPVTIDNCEGIVQELANRRTTWLEGEKNHRLLATRLQENRGDQTSQQLLLTNQQEVCNEKEKQLAQLSATHHELWRQRLHLFGESHPDEAEKQMQTRLEMSERQVTTLANLLNGLKEEHAALTAGQNARSVRINERNELLKTLTRNFTATLLEAGFEDHEKFLASRLEDEQRAELHQTIESMRKTIEETKARLQASTEALLIEKNTRLTDIPRENLEARLVELQDSYSTAQQEFGALRQQLQDNERQQQRHKEKLALLSARRIELDRWSRLHELIGSNDGKKFRNFAQGLTFEIMISHANTSLAKMSDRYLLVRDPLQPLELHVIDNYQGGEIRSTKNLSGGESFIVSMALALGLSTMASHNVQVDSLFLDEGFGTLDEESLQTALDTLAGLHQEGKIIGVISHVSGLRDRISTQIRIIPGPGGISRISGPGISKSQNAAAG